jgi:glycosyltransferase involved in cell wall biosynthesis
VFLRLFEKDIPFQATIAGDGSDRELFLQSCGQLVELGIVQWKGILPNDELQSVLRDQDVIVLTSKFEGFPVCILEGMANGCVPVCMEIESGLSQLISNDENGLIVPQGAVGEFVDRIAELYHNPSKRKFIGSNAALSIQKNYGIHAMGESYRLLLEHLIGECAYRRPSGKILPPPWLHQRWTERLQKRIRLIRKKGTRYLLRAIHGANEDEKTSTF